jgi:AmmeMemoRadiSam system protein B/AmmeMemoRadiSam system protein A
LGAQEVLMYRTIEPATRPAAVAGSFYPADAQTLRCDVTALLSGATHAAGTQTPKALIAPHAGYVYSGPIAAQAYAQVAPLAGRVRRVVLLGPAHRVAVRGLALPGVARFATPLGEVEIDAAAVERLRGLPQVSESARAHAAEHALEVHLPFLQATLGMFTLVPLVVGDATPAEVAEVLDALWGGNETLIVVSTDLSHYLPYRVAQETDRATVDAMLALEPALQPTQACGAMAVNGLLLAARRRALTPMLLDLRNSGDTAGDRGRVVGYGSLALYEAPAAGTVDDDTTQQTPLERGSVLLAHAREAIARVLRVPAAAAPDAHFLSQPGATFVTLKTDGALRGCIGSLAARRPLRDDVRGNAQAAAFQDPRFAPLMRADYARLTVEVSLLAPSAPLIVADEAELHATLRPGIDGLTLAYRQQCATFLPQVWGTLGSPSEFVAGLKRKLGLATGFWSDELRISRYTVDKWAEPSPAGVLS